MGGNPVTQQVAENALKKLKAIEITRKGAHIKYAIYSGNKVVAETGLRHSPKPDILVPHVKNDLMVNAQFVLDLARCPKDKDDWLKAIGET
jgi:hypothetical protein